MSDTWRTFYAMKNRRGGEHLPVRDKLLAHRLHICPGNVYHNHPRREILFRNRVKHNHACYVMYWRAHMQEFAAMQATIRPYNKTIV
jgi:hypothetical protein